MKWAEKNKRMIITVVVIIAVLLFVQFVVLDGGDQATDAKQLSPQDGGIVPSDWSPDYLAAELFDAIDGADSESKKASAYARFNGLNANQKIEVYNFWNDKYFDKRSWGQKHGSLTTAIRSEYFKGDEGIMALGALNNLRLP